MTTIRQLIQTGPAKANELFAKLADTSGNAVKTRERLFAELKEELELQMRLEEQHLFPVLRKRKETKDLVPDALTDNKQTRKLLAKLERTPKESEAFASKVAELRKAFQQNVRDERKELLPAVLKRSTTRRPTTPICSSARCRCSSRVRPGCPSLWPMRPAMPSSGSRRRPLLQRRARLSNTKDAQIGAAPPDRSGRRL